MNDVFIEPSNLRLLSALLGAPNDESSIALQDLSLDNPWLTEALDDLAQHSLEVWQGEHTRLFISGHPKTACPPFESVYLDGMMQGAVTEELSEIYQSLNLEPDNLPPDYLGALLEIAAYLLEQPNRSDQATWIKLWEQHLRTWVPRFARDLIEASELLLYRRLGEQLLVLFSDTD